MLDKIEMSLEDIIKTNKKSTFKQRRPAGNVGKSSPNKKFGGGIAKGRARGGITRSKYTRGDVNSSWKHDLFEGGRKAGGGGAPIGLRTGGQGGGASKLVVSNLDFSVSDSDINELFAEFGPLKTASVHYDRSGRSLGTADVVFERRNDAVKAMKQYNGVPLDGRPMSILLATSEIASHRPPIQRTAGFTQRQGGPRGNNSAGRGPPGGRGGGRRGGNSGGRQGGSGGRRPKTEVTVEDLNAELDAFIMQS